MLGEVLQAYELSSCPCMSDVCMCVYVCSLMVGWGYYAHKFEHYSSKQFSKFACYAHRNYLYEWCLILNVL